MDLLGMPIELLILDVDGVILDILAGLQRNLEATALRFGLPIDPIAKSIAHIAAGKMRIKGNARDSTRMLWPHLSESEICEFVRCFYEIERLSPYPLIEGSAEALSFFRKRGICLALATNNPAKVLGWRLAAAHIDPSWFCAIVTKDSPYCKPHPQTFDIIFQHAGVARNRACYVGDLQIDWDTARDAGVTFIAVMTGGVPRHAFMAEGIPHTHIFDRLSDILYHIED